jgi:hypothetical protein
MGTSPEHKLMTTLNATYLDPNDGGSRLRMRLAWTDREPWTVRLNFPKNNNATWTVLRSMLADGFLNPTGHGDIHIRPGGDATILITLSVPPRTATIRVDAEDLSDFLCRSYDIANANAENTALERFIDNEITRLFEDADEEAA